MGLYWKRIQYTRSQKNVILKSDRKGLLEAVREAGNPNETGMISEVNNGRKGSVSHEKNRSHRSF